MGRNADSGRGRLSVDPRLLIGIGLVVASVLGVVALVGAADSRVTVLAAPSSLVPGDRLDPDELVERSVSLDGADTLYLRRDEIPDDGLVVVGVVRKGELIPRSAVTDSARQESTDFVVQPASPVSEIVGPGSLVEIWASPADPATGGFSAPSVLVQDAVVTRVVADEGLVASSTGGAVEVRVARNNIARILQAQADGDLLAIVPAGLPLEE